LVKVVKIWVKFDKVWEKIKILYPQNIRSLTAMSKITLQSYSKFVVVLLYKGASQNRKKINNRSKFKWKQKNFKEILSARIGTQGMVII